MSNEFIHNETLVVRTQAGWRNVWASQSMPEFWDADYVASLNLSVIFLSPVPKPSGPYKAVRREGQQLIDGKWFEKYIEYDRFTEDFEGATVQDQKDEHDVKTAAALLASRKSECGRLIFLAMPDFFQRNIGMAKSDDDLTDAEKLTFTAGRNWVQDMRAACATGIWLDCPADVVTLVKSGKF